MYCVLRRINQQRNLRGSTWILCFFLAAFGTCGGGGCISQTNGTHGDNGTIRCYESLRHSSVRDTAADGGGHTSSTSSVERNTFAEVTQSFEDKHVTENETGPLKHSYLILNSVGAQQYVIKQEPVFMKAVIGEPFQMRCPLESSTPGTLYYWQRYKTIDRSIEIGFPGDAMFSESGRIWAVDVLSPDHNGMYECRAANERGEKVFFDVIDFFIAVLNCANHPPPTVTIEPSGPSSTHHEGDRVQLTCNAVPLDFNQEPFWYYNGKPCSSPTYQLEKHFDKSSCRWTSVLTIPEFSIDTAGIYDCTVNSQVGAQQYVIKQEPVFMKAVIGELFQMRYPLKSSTHGILYYWQRYWSIDRRTEIGFPGDAEFSAHSNVVCESKEMNETGSMGSSDIIDSSLTRYVKEAGTQQEKHKFVAERTKSFLEAPLLTETETQPREHNKNTTDSGITINEEQVFMKALIGEPFQMRCPLESSTPGTLYYWQRYKTIDRSTEIGFPGDAMFSESGRIWAVDVLSPDHNGMYECRAANERGEEVFSDFTDFSIVVSNCANHPTPTVTIEPSGPSFTHHEGDRVQLTCNAVPLDFNQEPFWYYNRTLCSGPTYQLENHFDMSSCRWTTVLTIPEFNIDTAGIYHCTYNEQGRSITLLLAECPLDTVEVKLALVVAVGMVALYSTLRIRRIHFSPPTEEPPYDGFEYDAFVSAHDEAKDFVLENILPPLESGPAPYRLCWHSRDFIPGIPIMEQIAHTMAKSRKIIFVFSEHFSQSQFCSAELELAMTRYMSSWTRCILPVALAGGLVPEDLRKRVTYLPVLSAGEEDVAGKIAKVMGEPIPAAVVDRLDDSLVEE